MQPISRDVLQEKYAKGDERTLSDVRKRVARALAKVELDPAAWEGPFLEALAKLEGQKLEGQVLQSRIA